MGILGQAWSRLKSRYLETFISRPLSVDGAGPLVTFTFDDVPRSALENGVPILEEHGIRATFYVALGMSDEGGYCDERDVKSLASGGHEIGCHTLTHYSLRNGTAEELHRDALDGKRALEAALEGRSVDHFAYPFGEVTLEAKKKLQKDFSTMRTSSPGLNVGRVDRNYLRVQHLYSQRLDLGRLHAHLARTCARGGWLILYTHDVADPPSPYGTSISDFRTAVQMAVDSGARIETISDALGAIEPPAPETRAPGGGGGSAHRKAGIPA